MALQTVPEIEKQIREAETTVFEAENVMSNLLKLFKYLKTNLIIVKLFLQALAGARSNAEGARLNAQKAQEKYAEQASRDADTIRRLANETKTAAHKLRGEADHLNGRVVVTENRISKLSDLAKKDNSLSDEAKEKVRKSVKRKIVKNKIDINRLFQF